MKSMEQLYHEWTDVNDKIYQKIENNTFKQLCDRILNKDSIPLLGSGISNCATHITENALFSEEFDPSVGGLKNLIKESFPNVNIDDCNLLGEFCERVVWKINGDYDLAIGCLVKALRIIEFTNLEPTPTHYYISFLVREGLIPKVFTTNYDSCLEKAFLHSFGIREKPAEQPSLSIVHDNSTCMKQKPGSQGSGEQLHLFKFNGCASALERDYENNSKNNYHKNILLTMTQLQNWRERRWAEDTFRVALRSNTIVFSGFGSDEPQIIHTIQQILDEYSSHQNSQQVSFDAKNLPPNAPIIQIFDSKPLFCQLQIVNNYVQAVSGNYNEEEANKLILNYLALYKEEKNLKADTFWQSIFQEIQFRLVSEILKNASQGKLSISFFQNSQSIFLEIHRSWSSVSSSLLHLLSMNDENLDSNSVPHQSVLGNCISRILSDGKEYHPLKHNQNLIAEFIFLLWLVDYSERTIISYYSDESKGDLVEITSEYQSRNSSFFILSKRNLDRNQTLSEHKQSDLRSGFCLSSDNFQVSEESKACRAIIAESNNQKKYTKIIVFSMSDLQESLSHYTELEYKSIVKERINFPSKFHSRQRKSKKTKYATEEKI